MRIIRYLKDAKLAVLIVVLLLVVQAFTDLSLPRYTSEIVDVGIQQSGVEHASPDQLSQTTFDTICMLVDKDDEVIIRSSYTENDSGNYVLSDETPDKREQLDSIMSLPLVMNHYVAESDKVDLSQVLAVYNAGQISKDQVLSEVSKVEDEFASAGEAIIRQQAIQATIDEYKSLGIDINGIQMSYLFRIGFTMLGIAAIGMVASIAITYVASRTGAKIGRNLRSKFFSRVVSFSDAEVQQYSAASLITRGTNDIQQIQMVSVMLLRMLLYAPILALGGIFMVSRTNLSMSWIIILAVSIILVIVLILFSVAMPKFRIMQKLIDRVNLVSREILTGLSVVRAFGRQDFEANRFDEASTTLMKNQLFVNRAMAFMMPLMMLIMNGVSVLIVWVGGSYIDSGTIQTGDLIAFITYSMVIIMSFLMISMMAVMLPRADVAAQRVNEVIDTVSSIHDPELRRDSEISDKGGAVITFDKVDFAYPDASDKVLCDVSFTAEAGKTTAFIGSTGSGKSTIIKLIERFYDVTDGAILLDGVDIRSISQEKLRSNFGYVPQKSFLFSGTINSNIAYSDEEMSTTRIEEAADIAQATSFIELKDDGFEASVSQGGTNVSGGQRQRLAIARALASDARALLFDDSFSALDFKTDAALRSALSSKLNEKTVLIVAQRISTIMHADQIVVLDDGKVCGIGTHEELLKNCECYVEIATSQLSEEELKGGGAL